MKRVQHCDVKQGLTIKLPNHGPTGRWATIDRVIEQRPDTDKQAASALVVVSYLNGRDSGKLLQILLYARVDGYEVHPNSSMIAARRHHRAGRADVKNIVLRDYVIKYSAVDRVDSQGETCGYCQARPVTVNIYAHCHVAASRRAEENTWPTCDRCALHSIDQVEDVDPSYTVTIERASSR